MDLQTIKFKADSTEIEEATHRIEQLDDSMTKAEKTIIQQNAKMAILRGQAVQLKDGIVDLGSGFTQSQAKMLANLATLDATGEELKQLATSLKEFNAISGTNPFDKSIGGVEKLRREIAELTNVNKLMQQGYSLTRDEIVNLSRDSERLTQIMKVQGAEALEISAALRNLTTETVFLARKRDELAAQSIESNRRAQEEARKALELDKQRALVNNKLMQDWAGGVGQRSPTQESMSSFYKQQSVEAERNTELQNKLAKEAAIAQQKSSDLMFKNQQLRLSQEQVIYKQAMSDLAEYYSNLEKLDKQAEAQRKQSFDRMIEINRLKQEQDRREYEKSMRSMREYYSEMEKQNAPAGRKATEGDMDSAVSQFRQAQAKATRDAAKANEYLIDAERRLKVALDESNAELSERYTDRLNKYQKALEKSGVAADTASAKMANFRKGIDQLQAKERANELNYLSRAISVQMGDVAVSLASGMNPLLVMIQQGDQIRGVIQQVGAEGKELSGAMRTAAAQIAMSFVDTGKAIGGFFLGTVRSIGTSVTDAAMQLLGFNKALDYVKRNLASNGEEGFRFIGMLTRFGAVFKTAVGLFATAGIASVAAFGIALTQVIRQENELARQLALTGGALGLSQTAAISYAQSLNAVGISTSKGIEVIQEMAKVGNLGAGSIQQIATAAVNMQKYAGVAIADTVKAFSEMKDKPVEALTELARKTGMVAPEVVRLVNELKEQGRVAEASALAIQTLADTNSTQVERMKRDLNGFSLFMIELGAGIKSFYDNAFKSLFYKANPTDQIKKQLSAVNDILNNDAGLLGMAVGGAGLGRGYYENIKSQLEEQLRLINKASSAEEERTRNNSRSASIVTDAANVRVQTLDKEGKYLNKVNELLGKYNEAVKLGLSEEAAIYQKAITKETTDYQEALDKAARKRVPLTEAEKEAKRIQAEFNKELEKAKDVAVQATGNQEKYTKAQKAMMDLIDNPGFYKFTEAQKAQILDILANAHAVETETAAMKEAEQFYEKRVKTLNDLAAAYTQVTGAAAFYGKFLEDVNNAVMEGTITDQEAADRLNAYARNRVFKPNEEALTKDLAKAQEATNADIARKSFELTGTAGMTESQKTVAMAQYDLQIQKMKEIDAIQTKLNDKQISTAGFEAAKQQIEAIYAQKEAWVAVEEQMKRIDAQSDKLSSAFTSAFNDLIFSGKSFGDVINNLTQSIMQMITEILVLEPLKASLKGIFGGMGGIEGIFGSVGDFFGGFFADGGSPPVGKVSVVGERGPELFVPKTVGTIIPNHMLVNSGGQQQSINVVQNFTIQGHSADRSTQAQVAASALQGAQRAMVRNT